MSEQILCRHCGKKHTRVIDGGFFCDSHQWLDRVVNTSAASDRKYAEAIMYCDTSAYGGSTSMFADHLIEIHGVMPRLLESLRRDDLHAWLSIDAIHESYLEVEAVRSAAMEEELEYFQKLGMQEARLIEDVNLPESDVEDE